MILEGVFTKTKEMTHNGRIYPESMFHYHLMVRKMRSSKRRSKIMNLFIK
jgi:uncharacterized protein YaiI (UPF0178 family)